MRVLRRFNPGAVPIPEAPNLNGSVANFDDLSYSWNAPENATDYKFQISQNSVFTGAATATTAITSRSYPDRTVGGYYARVQACNERGCSPWSNVVYLEARSNTAPTITLQGDNPYTMNEGGTYTEPGFTANDTEDGVITGSVQVTDNINPAVPGTYYKTYTVTDSNNNTATAQREVRVLAVQKAPAAPVINGAVNESDLNFGWNVPTGTDFFEYRYATDGADITAQTSTQKTKTTVSENYTGLAPGTNICAQIRACNEAGCSVWSNIQCLTVPAPELTAPNAPTLNGEILNGDTLSYSWSSPENTTHYFLQVATDPNFGAYPTQTSGNTYTQTGTAGTYYARVQACNDAGCSVWSNTVTLKIANALPDAPVLDGEVNYSGSAHWFWNSVEGVDYYLFEFDDNPNFDTVTAVNPTSATSHIENQPAPGWYYGRVRACNSSGCSVWSNVVEIAIIEAPLVAPVLTGSWVAADSKVYYNWTDPNDREVRYFFQISKNSTFTSVFYTTNKAANATTEEATFGSRDVYYYARVRAETNTEDGPWSNTVRLFIVDNQLSYIYPVRAFMQALQIEEGGQQLHGDEQIVCCVEFSENIQLNSQMLNVNDYYPGFFGMPNTYIKTTALVPTPTNYGSWSGEARFEKNFAHNPTIEGNILKFRLPGRYHTQYGGNIYINYGNNSVVTAARDSAVKIDKEYNLPIEHPTFNEVNNELRLIHGQMKWIQNPSNPTRGQIQIFLAANAVFKLEGEYGNSYIKNCADINMRLIGDNRTVFACTGIIKYLSSIDTNILHIFRNDIAQPDPAYADNFSLYINTANDPNNKLQIFGMLEGGLVEHSAQSPAGLVPITYEGPTYTT